MRLKSKVAIITGGSSGIGLACAKLLCKEGAEVIIFGRRQKRLDKAASEIGENVITVRGDVSQKADLNILVNTALEKHGTIDILINNAGVFSGAPIHEMQDEHVDIFLNVNLKASFQLSKLVLPHMIKKQSGSIIHISSISGLVGIPNYSGYSISKSGLIQLSRSIAVEYGPHGIRSNAVCPGMTETNITAGLLRDENKKQEFIKSYPLGRLGKPEDVAFACAFLASDEASFITGATLNVDGGYTSL